MNQLIEFWKGHGTKILGTLQTIVTGLIAIPDLLAAGHVKYAAAAAVVLGAMTVNRGFTNTRNQP